MTAIIVGIVCALVTAAITYIIVSSVFRKKLALKDARESEIITLKAMLAAAEEKSQSLLEAAQKSSREQLAAKDEHYAQLLAARDEKHASEIAAVKETAKAQLEAKEELLKEKETVKAEIVAQTEKILKERQEELSKGNKNSMEEILAPLRESMDKMQDAMDKNAKEHVATTASLKEKFEQAVKDMSSRTADIGAKADSLSEALTGRPKVQGCWGENFLDSILAREGLELGKHYTREDARSDQSRPDFIFHFKDGLEQKDLVVDSKVSLTAFVEYMNAEDDDAKKVALSNHVKSVRKHIDELASKEYAKKVDKGFADYVLMFMPIDMAYRVAIDADPMLWQDAYSRGVLIATEQTIMPFLKIIQLTWSKYQQDSNIMEIMKAADDVIDRVGLFYDSYKDLGARLKAVNKAYNEGINKLEDNGRSITTSARKLTKLGAKRSKGRELEIPDTPVAVEEENE